MTMQPVPAPGGNAKHALALVAQAEQLVLLRAEVVESLAVLADLARDLEALADSRQRLRTRLITAETAAILQKQTERDRAAARGLIGRNPDRTLAWLNAGTSAGSGQVAAPVETLPAVSVVAEIRYTLRHNIRRLGRPAKLTALEAEQTADEDHGYCPWPRHPILTTGITDEARADRIDRLAVRLAHLVGVYTNRKDLAALQRDLTRLEEAAKDITEGTPGKSPMIIGSETCPHCRRNTLALLSRVPGMSTLVIRCEGNHRCVCDEDTCACHRPRPTRHEWINSGHATNNFHDLKRAQNKLKETLMLETRATDAIAVIRAMHEPVSYQPWSDECTNPSHATEDQWVEPDNGAGQPGALVCVACPAIEVVCTSCHENDGSAAAWPCATALACDLDGELAALIATNATDPE